MAVFPQGEAQQPLDKRRQAYLEAMGIELWSLRAPAAASADVAQAQPPAAEPLVPPVAAPAHELSPAFEDIPLESYEEPPPLEYAEEEPDAPQVTPVSALDWPELAERVAGCRACGLWETRTQTVFGVGDRQARLMIIGEAPGADEDRLGEPFVGRAGQLLTAMLAAIGLGREQVYIANVLKCRPPGNRDPHADEAAACRAYLDRQIELIRPDLILSVGGVSAKNLLHTEDPVGRLRGRVHRYPDTGTPLRVTYHPAYLLRRPEEKAKAWADLQQVWRDLNGGGVQ
jgi:DNA polymerase